MIKIFNESSLIQTPTYNQPSSLSTEIMVQTMKTAWQTTNSKPFVM